MKLVKGICYGNDAFPAPYTESNANSFSALSAATVLLTTLHRYLGPLTQIRYARGAKR
jgi:hypothetical protein